MQAAYRGLDAATGGELWTIVEWSSEDPLNRLQIALLSTPVVHQIKKSREIRWERISCRHRIVWTLRASSTVFAAPSSAPNCRRRERLKIEAVANLPPQMAKESGCRRIAAAAQTS
ncbi:hypothetical protein UY3_16248 [Chelonia mydas]|uniref:Uncharacterized protein n=1 Tax=Chelonia mydas TaxID=8469 RepID=M7B3I6_CHEMY|nr:hypothetical protein UY3_16248 [Chelonia mydas]